MAKVDFTSVLAPNILRSSLDLLDVIQNEFSGLMSDKFRRYMINILLVIVSIALGVIEQSKSSKSKFSPEQAKPFKHLRNTCIQILQRFFDHFETYPWSDNEIDAIFMAFVSPLLHQGSIENVLTATPLLKLFATFAKYPRLFILLTRYIQEDSTKTPIGYVMELFVAPKAPPHICLTVAEMVQSLLTLADDGDAEHKAEPLQISRCEQIDESKINAIPGADTLNFGSKILLPHLSSILQRFKITLRTRRGLTKRDLLILSRITGLITDAETSKTLLTVLLPILVRKSSSSVGDEILTQMINTIINLFKRIDNPELQIRNVAPMFEQVTSVGPRKLLCGLLQLILERSMYEDANEKSNLEKIVKIVADLNAWDRRWIEQPDYDRRLTAYKTIDQLSASNEIDLNGGLLIIYHSFYFIRTDKDMALRDKASNCLKSILPNLIRKLQATKPHDLDYLIGTVMLNLIRRTFRDKNSNVRNEGIQLLGEMARECPDVHPILYDLNKLSCKDDREIDFFDNITHLQTQRHSKALLRFCSVAKTLEATPNPRTLTQFVLPLATMYIANEKYSMNHGLITSAIEAVGTVCRLLPWYQYEAILKYYIKNMRYQVEYQKQMVRIVMSILDSFHFDLSKADYIPQKALPQKDLPKPAIESAETKAAEEDAEKPKEDEEHTDEIAVEITNEQDQFYEELDDLNQKDEDDDDEIQSKKARICVYSQHVVLSPAVAKKIVQHIASNLIPTLNNSITALSTYESFHKINKKKRRSEREEEEILRVPIALAVVKLLQKLPSGILGKERIIPFKI